MRFYKTKCGVFKMAKKTATIRKSKKRSGAQPATSMRSAKAKKPSTHDPVHWLCWLADWLIELVKGYSEHLAESPSIPGSILNCFAVKLGLTPNEPSEWPYRPGDWSECDPDPLVERPLSLRDRESRESLIDRFEELKKSARDSGRWQENNLQCTATKEDLDYLLHCAYTIKSVRGISPAASVNPNGESKALVDELLKAGLLDPDWILLMRAGVLDIDLARLRKSPGHSKDLAKMIEKVLFPHDQEKPPIATDLLGKIYIGDTVWIDSVIQKLRAIQPADETHRDISDDEYVLLDDIPQEHRSRSMTLSGVAKALNTTRKKLHVMMRLGSARVAKLTPQTYVYDLRYAVS
jgi:hypothetical protein